MKIAVMGAGAVGCYYGGLLARAGHEVVLVARPAHVQAIQAHGLRIDARSFDEHVHVAAATTADAAAGADVVLFCVKSGDTEDAARSLQPHLAPGALLLTLQNGVDNAERVRAVLPGLVVAAAVVYVATEMAGPGHVRHHGRGDLVVEPTAAAFAPVLQAATIPTVVSDDVRGALWAKLILNCAYNALSAVAQVPYGPLREAAGVPAVMDDVVAECLAVAQAEGVQVPGDPYEAVRTLAATMPGQYSSTAQDLARGRPSEIDHLNGLVVRRGAARGIATPANRVLHTLVKLVEGRRAAP